MIFVASKASFHKLAKAKNCFVVLYEKTPQFFQIKFIGHENF